MRRVLAVLWYGSADDTVALRLPAVCPTGIMEALATPATIVFGPFVLDLDGRALLADGAKLVLSSRAFDILVFLVTERDRVVGKDEIMARVWRGVAVEENNLAVQISALRRVLGEHAAGQTIIATIPGHGYRFVGRVELPAPPAPAAFVPAPAVPAPADEPAPLSPPPPAPPRSRVVLAGGGALCLAAILLATLYLSRPAPPPRLSLAVLPFRNIGADPKQDYLADAITDDLTTDLSHIPGSVVIARESSDVYKGRAVPVEQIGRALHVRYLLEGSLREVDGTFHINAKLIDASNGASLWPDGFDVRSDNLHDAQTAIVGHLANALNVELVAIESTRSLHERPSNPDALDFYLRARSSSTMPAQNRSAQYLYEQAIALQPNYVDALAELSLLLLERCKGSDDPTDSADRAEAKTDIARALTLDPGNVTALTAKGLAQALDLQLEESEASLKAALAADPSNVTARAYLAFDDWRLGRAQATVDGYTEVLRVDPQGPIAKRRFYGLGMAYFMVGKFDSAIDYLMRGLAGDPTTTSKGLDQVEFSNVFLIAAYDRLDKKDQAKRLYQQYRRQWPHRSVWRLSSYFGKAQANMPGFKALTDGLADAGMPRFGSEEPMEIGERVDPQARGDLDPAPATIAGAESIDVQALKKLLGTSPTPAIIDVGSGAAALPGSIWVPHPGDTVGGLDEAFSRLTKGTTMVIIGNGFYGWSGYQAALRAVAAKLGPVKYLIGGEEALAASGYPTQDRRVP
jgi:TolB-like protein/DNA-binding winged helix-turn-helix (wHTH) protein